MLPLASMDKSKTAVLLETSFPTGNGVVAARGDEVVLDRDLRDSTGERWYWHVRLAAAHDAEIEVRLARPLLIGQFGPAVRIESEYDWLWPATGPDASFDLQIAAGATVYASATIPYGPRDLHAFRGRLRDALWWVELAISEGWREVPAVKVHAPDAQRVILLTCRHHACEAMASFVMEGAREEFVALRREGDPFARSSGLVAVPMMDVDGVHEGIKARPGYRGTTTATTGRQAGIGLSLRSAR